METSTATYRSRTCAVAIGILGRPQKPDWPIPSSLRARITYDITSVELRKVDTLIVGGGDSASAYAQSLVREEWRVVDRWWTEEPLDRRYFDLVLESGRNACVFRDEEAGCWFTQRA